MSMTKSFNATILLRGFFFNLAQTPRRCWLNGEPNAESHLTAKGFFVIVMNTRTILKKKMVFESNPIFLVVNLALILKLISTNLGTKLFLKKVLTPTQALWETSELVMCCLDDIFQRPNIGLHLQSWNTQVKTFVVLVQQERIGSKWA